jgi:membrane protein YqaA with SNARE-associated domain
MHRLTELFDRIVAVIQPWAEQYGAGGLAMLAMIDSSFLSLPQVADALLIGLTIAHPSNAPLYALSTALGSAAGCYALFAVGRKGGEAFLRKRFKARHIDRGLALVERHGWLAVTVPSLLPPPTPFKLFVLLAGVAGLRPMTFLMAAFVGRFIRYGAEAWLAYLYGDRATAYISERLPVVLTVGAAVTVVAAGVLFLWRRRRSPAEGPSAPA